MQKLTTITATATATAARIRDGRRNQVINEERHNKQKLTSLTDTMGQHIQQYQSYR